MGTTRIKVIDLSSQEQAIKTSRKHAEKLTGVAKLKDTKVPKVGQKPKEAKVQGETAASSLPHEPALPSEPSIAEPAKGAQTPKKATTLPKHRGKKYQEALAKIEKTKNYPVKAAIELLYKTNITKFDPTVELNLNVNDKNLRGRVSLPHPITAKKPLKYLLFASTKPKNSKNPIILATESAISEIESGKLKPGRDFNVVIAQPKFMPLLAKVAKILGPKGMMPNPKNSTVTEDVEKFFRSQQGDALEFKTDPTAPIIHTIVGKLSDKPGDLEENLQALIAAIGPTKIKKAYIKSTMSPAVKLDISTISI